MPTVSDILSRKGDVVHAISPDASVLDAVHKMNQNRCGAVVVMQDHAVVGMFTERDVLKLVGLEKNPRDLRVHDVMSTNIHFATPDMTVEDAGEMMLQRRIRHLPVCCDKTGRLHGLISLGDINAYHVQSQEQTILALNDYIYGRA